ncbi:tRNA (adenosine(37)-N6)-threonylcarbamoyltransferase complex dimerization subunit type 1 TsaB [Sphingomonas profundi]|uniref:tRNA (adenosine(37)-N6)-threonylcarbamoyltransferase complex dimerization subunit type 1 TsaB n=1 Tax=Alterirhizorhabdus profundi TaxID=2681549 RepID=UPI0012E83836|nr:tRNA (adenosine(37)-N6)-threonylcarbamoyltransferase complex dimerization subunit type 1 TsaB [Sphingomonas profundi]
MDLVIDTATAACSVALLHDGTILAERHEIVGRGHAERLVPQIAELLAEQPMPCAAIRVDCGPGSFTGVRVGLAAARALGLGWGVPVHGYGAMAVIAAAAFAEDEASDGLCVALTGGHGEIFVRRFAAHPFRATGDLMSLAPEAAGAMIADRIVVGSGAAALVGARGAGQARDRLPRAADARLLPPEWTTLTPSPVYGRPPDARPQVAA